MKLLEEKTTAVSLKNILFATDFSDASTAALPYVAALSPRYGGMMHVAHVLPDINLLPSSPIDPVTIGSIYEDAHSAAQEKMLQLALSLRGFPHHTYVRHGKVTDVLLEIIRENNVDMLVTGTHGRTGLGKLLLGSLAEEIFRTVTCPVLTVGPKALKVAQPVNDRTAGQLAPMDVEFRQIIYATDFMPGSFAAASHAFSLAQEFHARLILLHVIEQYGDDLHYRPGLIDRAFRRLEGLQTEDTILRYKPEPVVEFGTPADRILQTAEEWRADLIVLGARSGHIGAATHLPWRTAHTVVANAKCSVLTVHI
jgi:nucleotide-binding universal stress UspA family protein